MSNIIDSIRMSGTTYAISDSGGTKVVEITQNDYDNLPTSAKTANIMYVITDAEPFDVSNYYTKAETSGATELATAFAATQPKLSAGTNITIDANNVISAEGGGGKAVSGGRYITVTSGETADTINCTLPYYSDSGACWTIYGYSSNTYSNNSNGTSESVYIGFQNEIKNSNPSLTYQTYKNIIIGWNNKLHSYYDSFGLGTNVIIGEYNTLSGSNNIRESYVIGRYNKGYTSDEFICGWSNEARNYYETSFGRYNNSVSDSLIFGDSGNTLFSVGNGTSSARHNAFEIRQNGDIYITKDGSDVKLQDQLGGGGIDSGTVQTMIDQSISGKTNQTDFVSHSGNTSIHVTTAQTAAWDAKSDFSGSYNDLTDKPTIPTVPTNVSSFNNDAGYITSNDISGKTNQSDFVSHSGNTTMHVTASEKSTWNAKSDFSGNYNDLSNKPTIPTSASQLTNDSGYITSSALNGYATEAYVTAATNDMATKTWVGQQGYLTQHQDISGKQDVSGMTAYTTTATTNTLSGTVTAHTADTTIHVTTAQTAAWDAKSDFSGSYNDLTNKLSAGTNITIVDNVISATSGGGGKAVSGGRYITVTSGETADTVSFNLEIGNLNNNNHSLALNGWIYGTGSTSNSNTESGKVYGTVFLGGYNKNDGCNVGSSETENMFIGSNNQIKNTYGSNSDYNLGYNVVIGQHNNITGYKLQNSVAIGFYNSGTTSYQLTCGYYNKTSNVRETSFGSYNKSVSASTTFGNSGNTLFSVGNGTSSARHNALEIRQNGDIYVPNTDDTSTANWYQKPMVRLQDTITALGGLKLVKLTQSAYDALSPNYDSNTLYVIVN